MKSLIDKSPLWSQKTRTPTLFIIISIIKFYGYGSKPIGFLG